MAMLLGFLCFFLPGCSDKPQPSVEPEQQPEEEDSFNNGLFSYSIDEGNKLITLSKWNDPEKKEILTYRKGSAPDIFLLQNGGAFARLPNGVIIVQNNNSQQPIIIALPGGSFKAKSAPQEMLWIDVNSTLPLYRNHAKLSQECKIVKSPGKLASSACVFNMTQAESKITYYGFELPDGRMVWDCQDETGQSRGIALSVPPTSEQVLPKLAGEFAVITNNPASALHGTIAISVTDDTLQMKLKYYLGSKSLTMQTQALKVNMQPSGIIQLADAIPYPEGPGIGHKRGDEEVKSEIIPLFENVFLTFIYDNPQSSIPALGIFYRN